MLRCLYFYLEVFVKEIIIPQRRSSKTKIPFLSETGFPGKHKETDPGLMGQILADYPEYRKNSDIDLFYAFSVCNRK